MDFQLYHRLRWSIFAIDLQPRHPCATQPRSCRHMLVGRVVTPSVYTSVSISIVIQTGSVPSWFSTS